MDEFPEVFWRWDKTVVVGIECQINFLLDAVDISQRRHGESSCVNRQIQLTSNCRVANANLQPPAINNL
jgi:hypothetical protein